MPDARADRRQQRLDSIAAGAPRAAGQSTGQRRGDHEAATHHAAARAEADLQDQHSSGIYTLLKN